MDGALLGASDFAGVQRLMLVAAAVAVPCMTAVLVWPDLDLVGLWCGLVLWMLARAVLTWGRWRRTVGARLVLDGIPAPARQA
jgi:hypothetical protein